MWSKNFSYTEKQSLKKNDVIGTEGTFNARQILADVADKVAKCTTNSLTTRIIFEGSEFSTQTLRNQRRGG